MPLNVNSMLRSLAERAEVRQFLHTWDSQAAGVLDEALRIQAIPAPSFEEETRARYIEQAMHEAGLARIERDEVNNVYTLLPGTDSAAPALLISAHMDTVFDAHTNLHVTQDTAAGRITGPGIGDNSLGVAALIKLGQHLKQSDIDLPCDVHLVATTCEEGLGDLRGMRQACQRLRHRLGVAIVLEGIGLGRVYHAGLGVKRVRITIDGPGGHSWLHADRPSAIHHLIDLCHALLAAAHPLQKKHQASFNIGLISGGTTINTRAAQAACTVDMRAVDPSTLAALEAELMTQVSWHRQAGLEVHVHTVGERPSAALPLRHPLAVAAQQVLNHLGHDAASPEAGSTDANIPLALGIPAVCIGLTAGGNAHSLDEYILKGPLALGMKQLSLLSLLAAHNTSTWENWQAKVNGIT